MKKIIISIMVITAALASAVGAIKITSSLLSDDETSRSNTLQAGAIDLRVDNSSYYNGEINEGTTWLQPADLDDGQGPGPNNAYFFFDFHDLKPGDWGEDTISLHVDSNDAWGCMDITITKNDDVTTTEPEGKVDDPENPNDEWDGELAQNLNFIWWVDDGDNVLEDDEIPFFEGSLAKIIAMTDHQLKIVLADATENKFEIKGPLTGAKTYYLAKAWCFGTMELDPIPAGQGLNPTVAQGFDCIDNELNNITQTDVVQGDISFQVFQTRHNESFECYPVVEPEIDLSLTKNVDPADVVVGQQTTYTITVTNAGPDEATGVTVDDVLPAGVSYVSDTGGGAYLSDIWTIGSIPSGENRVLEITVEVTNSGTIDNIAQVETADQHDVDSTPSNDDPNEDDQDSARINGSFQIDLSLVKTADPTILLVGEETVYTITVNNAGPHDATGVTVEDVLPAGVSYVSDTGGGDYAAGIWDIGSILSGQSATIDITVELTDSGLITNIAQVETADQDDVDSDPGNDDAGEDDQDSASVTANLLIDLSLEKTVNDPSVPVGDNVTFTITVSNAGPNQATGVTVEDVLPAGVSWVSDDGGGSYNTTTNIWTIGAINASGSGTLNIVVSVDSQGDHTNTAQVETANEPDVDSTPGNSNANEDDQDSVTVHGELADLELDKTVNVDSAVQDTFVFFTITVTNKGPDVATNVQVHDTFPSGLPYASHTAFSGSFNPGTGVWDIPSIPVNGIARIDVTIDSDVTPDTYTNIAEVIDVDQPDPDSTPNNLPTDEDDDDSASVIITAQ